MQRMRTTLFAAATGASLLFALPALAATTVNVTLWDNPDMDMADNLGHGMGGDMSKASMGVKASTDKVPAGEVTFEVKNSSKNLVHEMIVSPLTSADEKLPYDTNGGKIDEDAAGHLGEVAELEPGQSGALRINLKPGSYILFCNIPGHYMGGMWTTITAN